MRPACQPIADAPTGFDYPLDALLPSMPRRFCFAPAALMGFTLRSFPLPKGIRRFPAGMTHVSLAVAQEHPKAILFELSAPISGLCSFRKSLAIKPVFSGPIAGCFHGFPSSRARGQKPGSGFRPNSSFVLRLRESRHAHQSLNRLLLGSAASPTASRGEQPNDPRRVSAPVHSWAFERANSRAMCSPQVASRVTADRPKCFASPLRSAGAAQQFT
jgi:hypothetical protein